MTNEEATEGLNHLFYYEGVEHILNTLAQWNKPSGPSVKEQIMKWVSDNCSLEEVQQLARDWSWGGLR